MPMTQHREIIDNIRGFLSSSQQVRTPPPVEWAKDYAKLCGDANDRLRKGADALKRGLRGDALQIAEAEPDLLDLVVALDFPDAAKWRGVCERFDLPRPPVLLIESAAALNAAYATEQPLQSLMAYHRVLALARAPLRERLMVMQRIEKLDPTNTFWDDDIRTFERARFEEMRAQLPAALKAGDATAVSQLRDEATASTWRSPVPQELHRSLQDAAARLAEAALRQLSPKLNAAYSAMAYEECKILLGKWQELITATRLAVPVDLQEQVEPIRGWVHEEDQRREQHIAFEKACNSLQQTLDTDQPTPAIERAYHAAINFHLDLPEELELRHSRRMATRALALRNRRRLLYTAITAGFTIALATIAIIVYQSLLTHEIDDAQKILAEALADVQQGQVEKGQALRKQLVEQHARIVGNPLIIKALIDLDSSVAADRQRASDFQQHMKAATAAGVEHPDEADLQRAISLAKTPVETTQVEQLKGDIRDFNAKAQAEIDQQFAADGAAISAEIETQLTPQLMASNLTGFSNQLAVLSNKVDSLRQRNRVSEGLRQAQLASLDAVLGQRGQRIEHVQALQTALQHLRECGSSAEAHMGGIKQFIAEFPEDPHCADFQRAIAAFTAEQAIESWSNLGRHWSFQMLPTSYKSAQDRVADVQRYLSQYPTTPLAGQIQAYLAYLNKGLEVSSPNGVLKEGLRKLVTNPLVHDLRCVDTSNGLRFFVADRTFVDHSDINGKSSGQSFPAITSPDMTKPSKVELTLKDGNLLKATIPIVSPQAAFAAAVENHLDAFDYSDWEAFGLDVTQELLNRQDIDPILQAILLQHILTLNQAVGEWSGQDQFGKVVSALAKQNVDDMQWLDPRIPPTTDTLKKLRASIDTLPPLPKTRALLLQRRDAILKAAQVNLAGEGILLHNDTGYEVVSKAPVTTGQIIWAIGADSQLVTVGGVKDGRWLLDPDQARLVPDGSLVFIVSAAQPVAAAK